MYLLVKYSVGSVGSVGPVGCVELKGAECIFLLSILLGLFDLLGTLGLLN